MLLVHQGELVLGSGVYVDGFKIRNIHEDFKRKPTILVRKLMKAILGEEVLKKSSPTGKNGWTPIPENVYNAVRCNYHYYFNYLNTIVLLPTSIRIQLFIGFVNDNASKKRYQIEPNTYRECLTQQCATLRNERHPKKGQNSHVALSSMSQKKIDKHEEKISEAGKEAAAGETKNTSCKILESERAETEKEERKRIKMENKEKLRKELQARLQKLDTHSDDE